MTGDEAVVYGFVIQLRRKPQVSNQEFDKAKGLPGQQGVMDLIALEGQRDRVRGRAYSYDPRGHVLAASGRGQSARTVAAFDVSVSLPAAGTAAAQPQRGGPRAGGPAGPAPSARHAWDCSARKRCRVHGPDADRTVPRRPARSLARGSARTDAGRHGPHRRDLDQHKRDPALRPLSARPTLPRRLSHPTAR